MSDGDAPTVKQDLGTLDTHHASESRDSAPALPPAKYQLGELLGRGGMGEVVLAEDKTIGRRVAIKRMRGAQPSADAVVRFLREAHIQARLDHPAIVPVHELGQDEHGRPYFTMKRLAGVTLHDVLKDGKATPQKLLRSFVEVCLAIEFAHQRGVIHRDIKPSNIMLGEFGEVYVLDWGVARVIGDVDLAGVTIDSVDPDAAETQAGAMLGTPGYMSPEQMRGEPITPATDVYALGSILFEILTGEPLHPRGAAMASTLTGGGWQPSKRVPDRAIAPELDAACAAALLDDPGARPSARALADAVQRYLDGDRDVEARRALAATHLAEAQQALAAGDRVDAMRFAGRALALDPESRDAASIVTQLMLQPPDPPPPALAQRIEQNDLADVARQGRYAAFALAGYLAFVPILMWIGVRDWTVVGPAVGLVVAMMAGAIVIAQRRIQTITFVVFLNGVLLVLFGRMFTPMILGPALAVATVAALSSFPRLNTPLVLLFMTAGITVPVVLEALGIGPRTTTFAASAITIRPDALAFGPISTPVMLCAAHVVTIVVVGLVVRSLANAHRTARRQLEGQTWMLEQLLPRT